MANLTGLAQHDLMIALALVSEGCTIQAGEPLLPCQLLAESRMDLLRVRNWAKFQHYKHRCPPWIKLAADTFQNPEFSCLQDASKLLAVCIWTLASRTQTGEVPDNFDYIKRWGFLGETVELKHLNELIESGFIMRASKMLATCVQSADSEAETETEKRHKNLPFSKNENGGNAETVFNELKPEDFEHMRRKLIEAKRMP